MAVDMACSTIITKPIIFDSVYTAISATIRSVKTAPVFASLCRENTVGGGDRDIESASPGTGGLGSGNGIRVAHSERILAGLLAALDSTMSWAISSVLWTPGIEDADLFTAFRFIACSAANFNQCLLDFVAFQNKRKKKKEKNSI